jgi:hypothetical protein
MIVSTETHTIEVVFGIHLFSVKNAPSSRPSPDRNPRDTLLKRGPAELQTRMASTKPEECGR